MITKQVNTNVCDKIKKMKFVEHQCWANQQYSTLECLEMSEVLESVTDNDLELKVLNLFEKFFFEIHPDTIEAGHWIKSNAGPKKITAQKCR